MKYTATITYITDSVTIEMQKGPTMNPTDAYRLKKEIDAALLPYQASAVSWVTSWSQLVIRKYDFPYSSDRSVTFEAFITDRADWLKQQPEIERELAKVCAKEAQGQPDGK